MLKGTGAQARCFYRWISGVDLRHRKKRQAGVGDALGGVEEQERQTWRCAPFPRKPRTKDPRVYRKEGRKGRKQAIGFLGTG